MLPFGCDAYCAEGSQFKAIKIAHMARYSPKVNAVEIATLYFAF